MVVNTRANRYDREHDIRENNQVLGENRRASANFTELGMVPHARLDGRDSGDGYTTPDEDAFLSPDEGEAGSPPVSNPRASGSNQYPPLADVSRDTSVRDNWTQPRTKLPKLPNLQSLIMLHTHLNLCEAILEEDDWDPNLLKCKAAIIATFAKFDNLQTTATSLVGTTWSNMRRVLVSGFCDSNYQRNMIEQKLQALRFDESRMMDFVHSVRTLYAITTTKIERRWFIERVFDRIPRHLAREVIIRIRASNSEEEWTSAKFDIIMDTLSDVIASAVALNAIKPFDRAVRPNHPQRPDRVQLARETPRETRGGNDSDWLQNWCDKHEGRVFYVSSSNDEKLDALKAQCQEWKALRRRKDNGTYHLAAFKTQEEAESTLSRLFEPREYHKFLPKN